MKVIRHIASDLNKAFDGKQAAGHSQRRLVKQTSNMGALLQKSQGLFGHQRAVECDAPPPGCPTYAKAAWGAE